MELAVIRPLKLLFDLSGNFVFRFCSGFGRYQAVDSTRPARRRSHQEGFIAVELAGIRLLKGPSRWRGGLLNRCLCWNWPVLGC